MLKKGIWASRNKFADSGEKENEMLVNTSIDLNKCDGEREAAEIKNSVGVDDVVSGFLYDRLQKEVINLRKTCETKESNLHTKDEEIKVLVIAMSPSPLLLFLT